MVGRARRMVAVLAVVAAACGGTDVGADGPDAGPADSGEPDRTSTTAGSSDDQGGNGDGNYATFEIGGTTYAVPADAVNGCNNLTDIVFGSFAADASGQAVPAGGTDVAIQINFAVPVADWETNGVQPPEISVDERAENRRWTVSTQRNIGSLDSWELRDGLATGSGTFVEQDIGSGEERGEAPGSFEILCRSS